MTFGERYLAILPSLVPCHTVRQDVTMQHGARSARAKNRFLSEGEKKAVRRRYQEALKEGTSSP